MNDSSFVPPSSSSSFVFSSLHLPPCPFSFHSRILLHGCFYIKFQASRTKGEMVDQRKTSLLDSSPFLSTHFGSHQWCVCVSFQRRDLQSCVLSVEHWVLSFIIICSISSPPRLKSRRKWNAVFPKNKTKLKMMNWEGGRGKDDEREGDLTKMPSRGWNKMKSRRGVREEKNISSSFLPLSADSAFKTWRNII